MARTTRTSYHPLYTTWYMMKRRCFSPKATSYEHYGGRGIKVCGRWLSFENFVADMGDKPTSEHTLERINNDGDYEPSNCCWASKKEQSLNKRCRKDAFTLTHKGVTKTLKEWSKEVGVSSASLRARVEKLGWSPAQALGFASPPPRKHNLSGLSLGRQPKQMLAHDGRVMSLSEWSRALQIKRRTIEARLKRGWTVAESLSTDPSAGRWH